MTNITETWRDIPDLDYSVSSLGRVASRKLGKWHVMKPWTTTNGYLAVEIHAGDYRKMTRVHRIVAEQFIGHAPTSAHEVNHKDGDKTNNRVDNLEWVTASENSIHSARVLGNKRNQLGELNPSALLTPTQVKTIRAMCSVGIAYRGIASQFSVSPKTVASIARRETWAHLA